MSSWRTLLVSPETPIANAIGIIDASSKQVCLVVDGAERLLGTVTDGDIRRGILKSVPLDAPVQRVMNPTPITAPASHGADELLATMRARKIHHLPLVDAEGRVVGLAVLDELIDARAKVDNWVVLMAGGLGTRLRPLTETVPKPLLRVGSKPILEIILEHLIAQGFHRFYVSVNYRAEMIKAHLGDGSKWDIEVQYIDETQRLGTAGPLSLLPDAPTAPVLVMNGDLLTKANLRQLLDYHVEHRAAATLAVRDHEFQVPYGVVRMDANKVVAIDEKPTHHFFVNAGIYVLEPSVIARIPRNEPMDMPDLLRSVIDAGGTTCAYPVREYWLDIGRMDDFALANRHFTQEFEGI